MKAILRRIGAYLNRRYHLVASEEESAWYAAADIRLDELAEQARLARNLRARGYVVREDAS